MTFTKSPTTGEGATPHSKQQVSVPDRGPIVPSESERALLARIVAMLSTSDEHTLKLIAGEGSMVEIPTSLLRVMREAAKTLARDDAVILEHVGKLLTLDQAAELLLISRSYLDELLSKGELPSVEVHKRPRVPLDDLLTYREHVARKRREALQELTRLSEELGLYDLEDSAIEPNRPSDFKDESSP